MPHPRGLSSAEVEARVAEGRVNRHVHSSGRTIGEIVRANVFTPVNAIIAVMLAAILVASPGPDALFAGVIVSNSVIGIAQELRARRSLQRLTLIEAPRAQVVRDGAAIEVATAEIVEDDVIGLRPGDQIAVDGPVLDADALEVDESLLTGESEPVVKAVGDGVLSGSFVVAGNGWMKAESVGAASYAARLGEEARRFKLVDSELRSGVNRVLKVLAIVIPPIAALLFWQLLDAEDGWRPALRGTVAATVAMVPDGLVLLTSLAFVLGIVALARHHVLTRELAAVELLARVDVLCIDKTGTLTTGRMAFGAIEVLGDDEPTARAALGALAAVDPAPNSTLQAVASEFTDPGWVSSSSVPFSSERKWSGAAFAEHGSWVLGAPDVLLPEGSDLTDRVREHALAGERVVLLGSVPGELADRELSITPVALVVLRDQLRDDAADALAHLRSEGITVKVISGDHPETVAAVARRAGLDVPVAPIDARTMSNDPEELAETLDRGTVFGRVVPEQKQHFVEALRSRGHVVAMTGDGVNDVLALKAANMGIAMGTGSPATRAVAEIVLLDNRFATFPRVLAEARRVINNVERSANLFLVGTAYSVLIALVSTVLDDEFPFLPRQLTLVRTLTIGVPGFFLAFVPITKRSHPGFLGRVLRFSIPSGLVVGTVSLLTFVIVRRDPTASIEVARTSATLTLVAAALGVLVLVARPLTLPRMALILAMVAGLVVALVWPWLREVFALELPGVDEWMMIAVSTVLGWITLVLGVEIERSGRLPGGLARSNGERRPASPGRPGSDAEAPPTRRARRER